MAIRLKDIARELDVSLITVSKALRGSTDISDATRQRILKRMKELDYQPNLTARSLATGQSFILGLIVPDLLNPFFAELAKSLGAALRAHSYGLILASSEDNASIEQSEIRMMLARNIDALVLASCQPNLKDFQKLNERNTPFVLIDRPFPRAHANFVGTDDRAGGMLATEHLIQLGRERLAYIGSPDLSPTAERFRGFRDALKEHNVALRNELVLASTDLDVEPDEAGYRMMQMLLKRRTPPNGVFCHNDIIAIGAMRATIDAGLAIPDDIAFVGFDNVRYSRYLQTPLTSVDQSTSQLGEAAAKRALALVRSKMANKDSHGPHKPEESQSILLAPTLVVRQSSVGDPVPERFKLQANAAVPTLLNAPLQAAGRSLKGAPRHRQTRLRP